MRPDTAGTYLFLVPVIKSPRSEILIFTPQAYHREPVPHQYNTEDKLIGTLGLQQNVSSKT